MKTIEERAFELYPDNPWCRHAFLRGCMFERNNSEKDLSLTWKDVKAIVTIADSMLTHTAWDAIDWPDEQKYYEEVLCRFNEQIKK